MAGVLLDFVKANRLGAVCGNNTSIRLKRNPDTVYGPDVCYFSAGRLTPEIRSAPVCDVIPNLVVEVRMPTNDHWGHITKAVDYCMAGVRAVLVVDLETQTATAVRDRTQTFHNGDEVILPDVLPGFAVPLKRLFE